MKVSGFSFIRNAILYDFPIVEAITSILPICDEFIVAVGKSDDDTIGLIERIGSPKIKILPTVWDDTLREGGKVLAVETDKALHAVAKDSDWAFYIQGDEVVHEQDLENIKKAMLQWKDNPKVEGLVLDYVHFYGSYDYIGDSRSWYRREIRAVRPHKGIFSYRDAQGFRIEPNRKLNVKLINAKIYHYGWVKPPMQQMAKRKHAHNFWNKTELITDQTEFVYEIKEPLKKFEGTHPIVMQDRVKRQDWDFVYNARLVRTKWHRKMLHEFYKLTGIWIFEYKNYKVLK